MPKRVKFQTIESIKYGSGPTLNNTLQNGTLYAQYKRSTTGKITESQSLMISKKPNLTRENSKMADKILENVIVNNYAKNGNTIVINSDFKKEMSTGFFDVILLNSKKNEAPESLRGIITGVTKIDQDAIRTNLSTTDPADIIESAKIDMANEQANTIDNIYRMGQESVISPTTVDIDSSTGEKQIMKKFPHSTNQQDDETEEDATAIDYPITPERQFNRAFNQAENEFEQMNQQLNNINETLVRDIIQRNQSDVEAINEGPIYVNCSLNVDHGYPLQNNINYGRIYDLTSPQDKIMVAIDRFMVNSSSIPWGIMPLVTPQPIVLGNATISQYEMRCLLTYNGVTSESIVNVPFYSKYAPGSLAPGMLDSQPTTDYSFIANLTDFIILCNDALKNLYNAYSLLPNFGVATGGNSNYQPYITFDNQSGLCSIRLPGYVNWNRVRNQTPVLRLQFNNKLAAIFRFDFIQAEEASRIDMLTIDTTYNDFIDFNLSWQTGSENYGKNPQNKEPVAPNTAVLIVSQPYASLNYTTFPCASILFGTSLPVKDSFTMLNQANAQANSKKILDDYLVDISSQYGNYRETLVYNASGLQTARWHSINSPYVDLFSIDLSWVDTFGNVRPMISNSKFSTNNVKVVFCNKKFLFK